MAQAHHQLLVAVATAPLTALQMPAAGALPCRSRNVATASPACLSAGDFQISAAIIPTQLLRSLSKVTRRRCLLTDS